MRNACIMVVASVADAWVFFFINNYIFVCFFIYHDKSRIQDASVSLSVVICHQLFHCLLMTNLAARS